MMSKAHRIILVLYCLSVVYCCIWIPWHRHISATNQYWYADNFKRLAYGWVWSGPENDPQEALYAAPDLVLIGLRLLASTAFAACAFLIAGIFRAKPAA
jgi:hypothetical protein